MGFGYGAGHGIMGSFGIVVVLVYFMVVAYALYLMTRITHSLKAIAASLERMSPGKSPQNPRP